MYVGQHQGKPVLYEYDNERKTKLSYPVDLNRSFYTEGDIICTSSMEPRNFKIFYPELFEPTEGHESILSQLAYGFLVGPPPDYNMGYKIVRITANPYTKGDGSLELQPLWMIDDKTSIEVGKLVDKSSMSDVGLMFLLHSRASSMTALGKATASALASLLTGATSGARTAATKIVTRKAATFTLREAMRRTAKRALIRRFWLWLKTDVAKNSANAIKAFVTTFVQELESRRELNELLQKAKTDPAVRQRLEQDIIKPSAVKAMGAFFNSLLTDVMGGAISKGVEAQVSSEIQAELLTRLFTMQSVGPFEVLLKSVTEAYAASLNDSTKSFGKLLSEQLTGQMLDQLKSLVAVDIEDLGAAAVK